MKTNSREIIFLDDMKKVKSLKQNLNKIKSKHKNLEKFHEVEVKLN